MKDFLGQELQVGDIVVVAPKNYRGLVKAKVVSLTPQKVRLTYRVSRTETEEYIVFPDSVVKVDALLEKKE